MLTWNHISINHSGRKILDNITISIKPKTITGILGPSGSGKSSLMKYIANTNNQDVGRNLPIGIVFQDLALWPHLTLKENILLPTKYEFKNISKSESEIIDTASILGIKHILNNYPFQSSLGEQQRASFLRALSINPQYLFLDEPTSALDQLSTKKIEILVKSERDKGCGILVISHDLLFLNNIADELFLLEEGKLQEYSSVTSNEYRLTANIIER